MTRLFDWQKKRPRTVEEFMAQQLTEIERLRCLLKVEKARVSMLREAAKARRKR